MSNTNDGGPAFPLTEGLTWPGHDSHGMSLRDYFAAAALGGILASNTLRNNEAVKEAVWYADELIAELRKPKGESHDKS